MTLVSTVIANNSTNIYKRNNHLSHQFIEEIKGSSTSLETQVLSRDWHKHVTELNWLNYNE